MNKKFINLFALGAILASCNSNNSVISELINSNDSTTSGVRQNLNPKMIVPNGTPLIAMSNYAINHLDNLEKANGADPLKAAFAAEEKDFIVAPINLGAIRYNAKPTYGLYKTLVWDNIYILSREKINSFEDLENKSITAFGKGSTPQIVFDTIAKAKSVTCNIDYVDNVQIANSAFLSGTSDIVISAQPQVSAVDTSSCFVTSLNDYWKEVTGLDTYSQAGLFVKISELDKLQSALEEFEKSYEAINEDISKTSENAEAVTGTFKKALLEKAIPNSGFKSPENEKELVKAYYQAMIDLGMGQQVGGKIPDEGFFLHN